MLNLKLPKYLIEFIDKSKSLKCRAWYITKCIQFIYDNNINIYEHYEGVNNERVKIDVKRGAGKC